MRHVYVINGLEWHGNNDFLNWAGLIPQFLSAWDERTAKEQLDENYAHGGGWFSFGEGQWKLEGTTLHYPEDPPLLCKGFTRLRNERICIYAHALVAIIQDDGSFEVARLD